MEHVEHISEEFKNTVPVYLTESCFASNCCYSKKKKCCKKFKEGKRNCKSCPKL